MFFFSFSFASVYRY